MFVLQGSVMVVSHMHDGVLEILIDNPPVNALGASVRQGLLHAIESAQGDPAVHAIVVRGSGKLFSGGADITEFGKPPVAPALSRVVDAIEASAKPVVAAINGRALGGGLEVALACHYRVASTQAWLGLPEVTLGLLPGAGGTQRLPRLVGVETALDMIVSGKPVSAQRACETGLIDRLAGPDALPADAIAFARSLDAPRRTGDRNVPVEPGTFERLASAYAGKIKGLDAPAACIEAIRAATELPIGAGQAKERALFQRLLQGDQTKALRHAFFAERAAAKIDGLPKDTRIRPIDRVGVIGAGTMGAGISINFLSAGIPVTIVEMTQDALDRGTTAIRRTYDASVAKARLTEAQAGTAIGLLTPSLDFEALADCDLVIEAVYENMAVKQQIFTRLDAIVKPGAILASNTSYLSIDDIAAVTGRPGDVLGLHFFSPANIMKLLEVVRGQRTAPDVLATGLDLARRIGKVPVVAGVCHGFIGNRMLIPRQTNATALLIEGATPEQVDRVHTGFGMPMGPFGMADLAGVDIGWHRDATRIESLRDALCAEGRWGQKTNAGFYDYDDRRRPTPSPEVARIIARFRAEKGVVARAISDEEIVARTLYTMVNEGYKILEEGIAQRASDIDVVWLYGYGWPRHKGGPMFWANQVGLDTIVEALGRYADRMSGDASISPLLAREAAAGGAAGR